MKRVNPKKVATALAILGVAVMVSGCGSSSPTGAPVLGAGAVAGAPGAAGLAGCENIAGPIGGTVQGAFLDGIKQNIAFGTQPMNNTTYYPGQSFGGVSTIPGGVGGPYTGQSPAGTISFSFTPTVGAPAAPSMYGQTGLLSFTSTISAAKQQLVLAELQSMYPQLTTMSGVPGTMTIGTMGTTNLAAQICIVSAAGNFGVIGTHLFGNGGSENNPQPGTLQYYFYITSMMSMYSGITSTTNPAALTGSALYSLNRIVEYY